MTNKELKRLTRSELLELLLAQTKEAERLKEQLEDVESKLNDRNLHLSETGDLAHAVLMVNGVMDAAQAAARQYLDNIAAMEQDARAECDKMVSDTKAECERMLAEARTEAANIRRKAREGRRKAKKAAANADKHGE